MDPHARRAARVALPLLAWAGLVVLAVLQGRALRDTDPGTGSVALLALWSLGAIASLYVALVQLLRARAAADRDQQPATTSRPPAPRHRA